MLRLFTAIMVLVSAANAAEITVKTETDDEAAKLCAELQERGYRLDGCPAKREEEAADNSSIRQWDGSSSTPDNHDKGDGGTTPQY